MTGAQADESNLEDFLTRIPLFAEIDRVALAQLAAHLDPIVFEEGDTVCRQGEPGDCLYVLTAGRLGVHVHDPDGGASRRIDGLNAGDFFGEMALLTGEPRSATVRAEAGSRVLRLERERFEALVREQPSSFLAIARGLSRRLASANRIRLVEEQALAAGVEATLERLPPERRQAVLEASLLEDPAELGVLFGDRADAIATDLAALGAGRGGTVVRDVLRERLRRDEGPTGLRSRAEALAARRSGFRTGRAPRPCWVWPPGRARAPSCWCRSAARARACSRGASCPKRAARGSAGCSGSSPPCRWAPSSVWERSSSCSCCSDRLPWPRSATPLRAVDLRHHAVDPLRRRPVRSSLQRAPLP